MMDDTQPYVFSVPQYLKERDIMQGIVDIIRKDFPTMNNTTHEGVIEHCYADELTTHAINCYMNVESGWWRMLVAHPSVCGCNALTNDLVLHG